MVSSSRCALAWTTAAGPIEASVSLTITTAAGEAPMPARPVATEPVTMIRIVRSTAPTTTLPSARTTVSGRSGRSGGGK